jgi:hypothetical protein
VIHIVQTSFFAGLPESRPHDSTPNEHISRSTRINSSFLQVYSNAVATFFFSPIQWLKQRWYEAPLSAGLLESRPQHSIPVAEDNPIKLPLLQILLDADCNLANCVLLGFLSFADFVGCRLHLANCALVTLSVADSWKQTKAFHIASCSTSIPWTTRM